MTISDLMGKVAMMFPQAVSEDDAQYQFYLAEVKEILIKHNNFERAWDGIVNYDGNTKRPKFAFFKSVMATTRSATHGMKIYYKCKCGTLLNGNSNGGCPVCHATDSEMFYSKELLKTTACQSSCFDCSIYTEFTMGPGCPDYGTLGFETCKDRSKCKCVACCRFEYLRTYKPEALRSDLNQEIASLPTPISEAGKAFQDDRASIKDINGMFEWRAKQHQAAIR